MLTTQRITEHRDLIVIDPWPEPLLRDQYQELCVWIQGRRDFRQIIWASYESGQIDPAFQELVTEPRSSLMRARYALSPTVWIAGQEWWRCVHARPLGIHQLVSQGYNIAVDTRFVWYRHRGFDLWRQPQDLVNDAYQWQQVHSTQWLLTADLVNRTRAKMHLSQQDN
jgi:hypothetical protein